MTKSDLSVAFTHLEKGVEWEAEAIDKTDELSSQRVGHLEHSCALRRHAFL